MGVVFGVDGGNSKTDVVLASTDGAPLAYVRGPGSNAHSRGGPAGCVATIASLVEQLPFTPPADRAVLFLCGADVAQDIAELTAEVEARAWAADATIDNDTFALLHAGSDRDEAVAVVCGSGINCVGRSGGRVARWPALGWETGDWGGAEELGRNALTHANRAADGREPPTALVDLIESHFGKPVVEVGADIHYGRMHHSRMGEIAPALVDLDDAAAEALVLRLAEEIALLVERAFRELEVDDADVVLGGGMFESRGRLFDLVAARLPVAPLVPELPPVAGSVLAGLGGQAQRRFRSAFARWTPGG